MSHFNRGKAARVNKAAAAVLNALKAKGFNISQDEEANAIRVAIASLTEREDNPGFLYFEHDIGTLCEGVKEFVFIRVEPIKIGCDDTQEFDAAHIFHGHRDNPDPWPILIHGDPSAILALLKNKMVNFTTAFYLRSLIEELEAAKVKKYGKLVSLHFADLEKALSIAATT